MPRYNPNTGALETYQPGPFDAPHLYLQWGGKLPGNEAWSCGLRMASAGAFSSLDPAGMLTGVTSAVQTYHSAANTCISSAAKLSFVKLNAIGEDGKYIEDFTYESIVADVAGGLTPSVNLVNQLALAVSLTTGVTRGAAHRGRYYLPIPGMALGNDGMITAAHRDLVKGTTTTFINALNAVNSNYDVAVFSRKLGAPAHRVVTGNAIGRVIDTQRRRRRNVTELWA